MAESEALPPDEEVIKMYLGGLEEQPDVDMVPSELLLDFLRYLRSYWPTMLKER